ncbi:MAG: acyl-CoA thioesterase [Planctomycetes bacterium]|nr:acyl-CoA thioesterase [Planctomycetota bacterium]
MPAIFEFAHRVRPDEIDSLGHANNLAYLQWFVRAAVAHSAAQGWPTEAYFKLGAGWVVRRHEIKYLRSALVDEELVVRTWLAQSRKFSCLRRYQLRRVSDGEIMAAGETEWAFITFATGNLARIPDEVASAFVMVPNGEAT